MPHPKIGFTWRFDKKKMRRRRAKSSFFEIIFRAVGPGRVGPGRVGPGRVGPGRVTSKMDSMTENESFLFLHHMSATISNRDTAPQKNPYMSQKKVRPRLASLGFGRNYVKA